MKLSFNYNVASMLPRRTFIVNVETSGFVPDCQLVYEVTAPDQIFAQEIVRRFTDGDRDVITFWTYAIREVVTKRDGTVYIRPFMLEGESIRFPYRG